MSEKQTDVEHALSAFAAPAIPYQRFNNGIAAAPGETAATADHAVATPAFPLLAASLPALSGLTLDPVAASAPVGGNGGPAAPADPGAHVQAERLGPGRALNGFPSPPGPIAAPMASAREFAGPTASGRPPKEAAGRPAHCGHLSLSDMFRAIGAPPEPHPDATPPPDGDLRRVFRMLDRTG